MLSRRVYGTTENGMGALEKKVCFHRDISPCKMEYYAKGGRDMAEQPLSPEEGFASILERYEKMVYGFALARTGSRADADDVFQEVFLAYFQCGKHFREEEHRRAWLLRTTLNFSRRVTASPWRRRVVPLSERADAPVQFQTSEQTGLWSALSSLPDGLRVPLYLFYFEELSTQEIARLLSLRPGAVRMRLSRGREHLRELLKGDYFHE